MNDPVPTRKPTGRPPWPTILVEGGEKTGKSMLAAYFAKSGRFDRVVWIDWNEGSADEYDGLPGPSYDILEHNGSFRDVANKVHALHGEARAAADAGSGPWLLVVDTMTAEWEALKNEAHRRAVETPSAQKKLANDPGADVPIPQNVWNDVTEMHGRFMRLLHTWPGPVVMIARGKEISAVDADGKPTGEKDYRVEGHKNLGYDASVWIRMSRTSAPTIIGARSLRWGIRPGRDKPRQMTDDESLSWLTFDVLLGGQSEGTQPRTIQTTATTRRPRTVPDRGQIDQAARTVTTQVIDETRAHRDTATAPATEGESVSADSFAPDGGWSEIGSEQAEKITRTLHNDDSEAAYLDAQARYYEIRDLSGIDETERAALKAYLYYVGQLKSEAKAAMRSG